MYLYTVFVLVPSLVASFPHGWHPHSKFHHCGRNHGTQCLSRNTFIFCPERMFYLDESPEELICPQGYICQDHGRYPCVRDSGITFDGIVDCGSKSATVNDYRSLRFYRCSQNRGLQCLNKNSFVYCSNSWQFFITKFDALMCPKGYVCQEDATGPCIRDPKLKPKDCKETSTVARTTLSMAIPKTTTARSTDRYVTSKDTVKSTNAASTTKLSENTDISIANAASTTKLSENTVLSSITNGQAEVESTTSLILTTQAQVTNASDNQDIEYYTTNLDASKSTTKLTTTTDYIEDQDIDSGNDNYQSLGTTDKNLLKSTNLDEDVTITVTDKSLTLIPDNVASTVLSVPIKSTAEESFSTIVTIGTDKIFSDDNTTVTTIQDKSNKSNESKDITQIASIAVIETSSSPSTITKKENDEFKETTSPSYHDGTKHHNQADVVLSTTIKSTTISQKIRPSGPPTCLDTTSSFPAASCNQYYQCEKYWVFWKRSVLKTCEIGENFSTETSKCVPLSESNCID